MIVIRTDPRDRYGKPLMLNCRIRLVWAGKDYGEGQFVWLEDGIDGRGFYLKMDDGLVSTFGRWRKGVERVEVKVSVANG